MDDQRDYAEEAAVRADIVREGEEELAAERAEAKRRTQDEILARFRQVRDSGDDILGFHQEVLLEALDYQHAREFLKPGVTADDWKPYQDLEGTARRYLTFAIQKILGHRGISATRSVDKLTEFAWLLGRLDVVEAMARAGYPQYGAPTVKAFADGMGWPFLEATLDSEERVALERMAAGDVCEPGCASGCGQ